MYSYLVLWNSPQLTVFSEYISTFWTFSAQFNNTVILTTVIIWVTIIVIWNFHTISFLKHWKCWQGQKKKKIPISNGWLDIFVKFYSGFWNNIIKTPRKVLEVLVFFWFFLPFLCNSDTPENQINWTYKLHKRDRGIILSFCIIKWNPNHMSLEIKAQCKLFVRWEAAFNFMLI